MDKGELDSLLVGKHHEGYQEGYSAGEQDLVEWIDETVFEWAEMKIIDDRQHVGLLKLLLELQRRVANELEG